MVSTSYNTTSTLNGNFTSSTEMMKDKTESTSTETNLLDDFETTYFEENTNPTTIDEILVNATMDSETTTATIPSLEGIDYKQSMFFSREQNIILYGETRFN